MRSPRFLSEPLRALIWIEAITFVLAIAGDIVVALTVRFSLGPPLAPWLKIYLPLLGATAAAIFSIPHAPNRRFWAIGCAIAGSCAIALTPSAGITPFDLLAVLAARLTFAFGLRGAILAWGTAFATLLCNAVEELHLSPTPLTPAEAMFGIYGYSVQLALFFGVIGITWLYANRAAFAAASAERARVALDLHDSLGHALTTLIVQLQNAERLSAAEPQKSADYVRRATVTASELLGDVRETVSMLHDEPETAQAPLASMLSRLHADFSSTLAMHATWKIELAAEPSGRIALTVYRVLQEALTNIARHAKATRIQVDVQANRSNVELYVQDDGCGFSREHIDGHGLLSMQTRIEAIGGTFEVASALGTGTRLHARIPLEAAG